jgi:hypothetical protein
VKGIGGGRVGFDVSGAAESVGIGTVRFVSGWVVCGGG